MTLAAGNQSIAITNSGIETITGGSGADTLTLGASGAFTLAKSRIYSLAALVLLLAAGLSLRIPELPLRTTHDRAAVEPSDSGNTS